MSLSAILAFTFMAVNAPPVQVRGDSLCPSASEVAAILAEVLPPSEASYADTAWVEAVGLDLRIELRSLGGEIVFSRRVVSSGTCADLATIAAVVIASWTAERNPGISLLQPGVSAPSKPAASRPPSTTITETRGPAVPAQQKTREFELSLAVGSSESSSGFAGAARAELGMRGQRLGLRSAFAAETERKETIASKSVVWRRYDLSLGSTLAVVKRPVMLEARAEIFAGITTVSGQTFDVNRNATAVAPGVALALRLGTATDRVRPWIEIGGQSWLAGQEITVTRQGQSDSRAPLPRLEGRLFAGISLVL